MLSLNSKLTLAVSVGDKGEIDLVETIHIQFANYLHITSMEIFGV